MNINGHLSAFDTQVAKRMESSCLRLDDLPDELLLTILKKLFNTEVLYSFVGSNRRLNTIVHDASFTHHLTLMTTGLDGLVYPLASARIDRFCLEILPRIHHQIRWLDLEASSIERILGINYPNLHGIGIYNMSTSKAQSLFIGKKTSKLYSKK